MVFLHNRSLYILISLVIIFIISTIHQIRIPLRWKTDSFHRSASNSNPNKYAFATLLASTSTHSNDSSSPDSANYVSDAYFTATRILTYQLIHAPKTRSNAGIPFLVLVTSSVPQHQRDRLEKDGATVVSVENLHSDWVVPQVDRWKDVMAKLRLWQLTSYSKVLFLDADSIITAPLDDVFSDPAAQILATGKKTDFVKPDEAALPETYMFAGIGQLHGKHSFPPSDERGDYENLDYLNAGFFLISPDQQLFDYYVSLLSLEGRFDPAFPEQNMLNYAHRRDGNMPWKQLNSTWNIMGPTFADYEAGAKSLHEKWWDVPSSTGEELRRVFLGWRWRMEGFFEGMDRARELKM